MLMNDYCGFLCKLEAADLLNIFMRNKNNDSIKQHDQTLPKNPGI
jgi:hypothetical protein